MVSELHCSETSGLMRRVSTKVGLLLFYTCCYAVWGEAEHKVTRDDAAELLGRVQPSRGTYNTEVFLSSLLW